MAVGSESSERKAVPPSLSMSPRFSKNLTSEYADIFYMNKKKTRQGAFRYRQTSWDRWMSPTNALDAKEALTALKAHDNKWEALKFLSETFPRGVIKGS